MVNKNLPVRWDDEALKNLKTIYKYIKKESPDGAEKVKTELFRIVSTLTTNPEKYPEEPLLKGEGNYRFMVKWSYKIIYEITSKEVIIALIFHTSQSPSKIKKRR